MAIKYVIIKTYSWSITAYYTSRVFNSLAEAKRELNRLYAEEIVRQNELNEHSTCRYGIRSELQTCNEQFAQVDAYKYSKDDVLIGQDTTKFRIIEIEI